MYVFPYMHKGTILEHVVEGFEVPNSLEIQVYALLKLWNDSTCIKPDSQVAKEVVGVCNF